MTPELVKFLASDWGNLKFLIGLVVLPWIYLKDKVEVQKDCALFFQNIGEQETRISSVRQCQKSLHVFELEWWFIVPVVTLCVSIFFMGSVARWSDNFQGQCEPNLAYSMNSDGVLVQATALTPSLTPCSQVEAFLNGFGLILAVGALFCVRWFKSEFFKTVQGLSSGIDRAENPSG